MSKNSAWKFLFKLLELGKTAFLAYNKGLNFVKNDCNNGEFLDLDKIPSAPLNQSLKELFDLEAPLDLLLATVLPELVIMQQHTPVDVCQQITTISNSSLFIQTRNFREHLRSEMEREHFNRTMKAT